MSLTPFPSKSVVKWVSNAQLQKLPKCFLEKCKSYTDASLIPWETKATCGSTGYMGILGKARAPKIIWRMEYAKMSFILGVGSKREVASS